MPLHLGLLLADCAFAALDHPLAGLLLDSGDFADALQAVANLDRADIARSLLRDALSNEASFPIAFPGERVDAYLQSLTQMS